MKRVFTLAFIVLVGILFTNCELDTGENFYFVSLNITDADVPDFFVLNQSHNMEVTFLRPDSCTFFQGFDVFTDENGLTTIVAIGSVLIDEDDCSVTDELLTDVVTIPVKDVDFYTLRFYIGEDAEGNPQYDEHRVPVVDGINQ